MNIYTVDNSGGSAAPGALIATKTTDAFIYFRPSWDDVQCTADKETPATDSPFGGKWFDPVLGYCVHGYNTNIEFDFSADSLILPDEVIFGVAYNTADYGVSPIGAPGPYNSLNYGLSEAALTGTDVETDTAFLDSTWGGNYCDGGSAGTGTLRRDPGCWAGYVPTAKFEAVIPGPPVYDGDHACGEGKVAVLLDDLTTTVDAVSGASPVTITLPAAGEYLFEATGNYGYGGYPVDNVNNRADAGYATGDAWAGANLDSLLGIASTAQLRGVTSLLSDMGTGTMGIVNWGDYDLSHIYKFLYTPASTSVNFIISDWYDSWYAGGNNNDQGGLYDNEGSLTVNVYQCVFPDEDDDGYTSDVDCDDTNAAINPGATEICNGVDDDCEGGIDEGFHLGGSCTLGIGECSSSGVTVCKADFSGTECNAIPGTPASETCDGLDNDCDGTPDEELGTTTCGLGVCEHTIDNCIGGVTQTCDPFEGATEEICDTLDNDCDGAVDTHVCDWYCVPTANDLTTMSPLIKTGTNRWIFNPGASLTAFVTTPPKGKGWLKGYALTSTNGCSCSQILTQLHTYNPTLYGDMSGHWKYGCSISVMDDFIRLINPNADTLIGSWLLSVNGGAYLHDMFIVNQDVNGVLTGTGGYPSSGPPYWSGYDWTLTGQVTGTHVDMTITYSGGYVAAISGTIIPWTSMSGGAGTGGVTDWSATRV